MICPYCGAGITDNVKFCVKCGKQIPYCAACGKVIGSKVRFCIYDGTPVPDEVYAVLPEGRTHPAVAAAVNRERRDAGSAVLRRIGKWLAIAAGVVVACFLVILAVGAISMRHAEDAVQIEPDMTEEYEDFGDAAAESVPESPVESQEAAAAEEETWQETYEDEEAQDETAWESEPVVAGDEDSIHTYEIIMADVSWTGAYYDCLARGGYLVRLNSPEEYAAVTAQIAAAGLENGMFWLGGSRSNEQEYRWRYEDGSASAESLNGEEYWLEGEPSLYDESTDAEETVVLMFHSSAGAGWVWNDVPDDILSVAPFYAGKLGYICEYED